MKKILTAVMIIVLCGVFSAFAAELKVGDKAPDFSLKDSKGKAFSLQSPEFQGKVMSVFYVDPDEKDLNSHVEDALLKDTGLERNVRYKALGITNLKASKMPNFLIKSVIKSKQEKTGAIILLDYDYTILNLWGLKNDTSSLMILDKERICRYVYNGKLPPAEVEKVLKIIKEYQVK
ncbi:MAG: YtfJ family protein [Deltaproteobacteria bacterium]